MKQSNLVAIDNNTEAGAVIYWSLRGGLISHDKFCEAWKAAGGNPACLPDRPSPETALRRAVAARGTKRRLARPGSRRGTWSIVQEVAVGEDMEYRQLARAHLDEGSLVVKGDAAECSAIEQAFTEALGSLTQDDVSAWLVWFIDAYSAVRLKPNGGLYYLPPAEAPDFARVAKLVEKICIDMISIEYIPAMNRSSVVRAVLDGLMQEIAGFTSVIDEAIEKGVGKRALRNRAAECDAQIERMSAYESMLGSRVEKLRSQINAVKARAVMAAVKADSED